MSRPGVFGLIEKRNLRSVFRKAFPVHEHAMPAPEINRLVIPVPDFSTRIDFGVAHHATPAELPRFWVACDELLVLSDSNARRVPAANHHRVTTFPHRLRTDVRLAATTAAERFIA